MRTVAAIDLGSNTFHLLIAQVFPDGNWQPVYRDRRFVFLSADGLQTISKRKMEEGLGVVEEFAAKLKTFRPQEIAIIATATLRSASNSKQFAQKVKKLTGQEMTIVSGEREAELIFYGANQAIPLPENRTSLLMDIGGGSTEFVLSKGAKILWKASFPAGVTLLKKQFPHSEPPQDSELEKLRNHLSQLLEPAFRKAQEAGADLLIGSSGSFETLADLQQASVADSVGVSQNCGTQIHIEKLEGIFNQLLHLPLKERLRLPGMHPQRAELMPIGAILVQTVLQNLTFEQIWYSPMALKEGIISILAQKVQNQKYGL